MTAFIYKLKVFKYIRGNTVLTGASNIDFYSCNYNNPYDETEG